LELLELFGIIGIVRNYWNCPELLELLELFWNCSNYIRITGIAEEFFGIDSELTRIFSELALIDEYRNI